VLDALSVDYAQVLATGLTYGAIFGVVALGYHLIYVSSGMLNFALGEQLAIAGLVVLSLQGIGVPLVLAIAAAVVIAAVFGATYERLALRPALKMGLVGPLIASVGVAIVIGQARVLIWGPNPRSFPPFSGEPNETESETSAHGIERRAPANALPAAARSRARRESRSRVRSRSSPSVVSIASSVLWPGCNSRNAGSQSASRARSAKTSSSTVLPTPRRPATRIPAGCSGAARNIVEKRRSGPSRPAT